QDMGSGSTSREGVAQDMDRGSMSREGASQDMGRGSMSREGASPDMGPGSTSREGVFTSTNADHIPAIRTFTTSDKIKTVYRKRGYGIISYFCMRAPVGPTRKRA